MCININPHICFCISTYMGWDGMVGKLPDEKGFCVCTDCFCTHSISNNCWPEQLSLSPFKSSVVIFLFKFISPFFIVTQLLPGFSCCAFRTGLCFSTPGKAAPWLCQMKWQWGGLMVCDYVERNTPSGSLGLTPNCREKSMGWIKRLSFRWTSKSWGRDLTENIWKQTTERHQSLREQL